MFYIPTCPPGPNESTVLQKSGSPRKDDPLMALKMARGTTGR